MFQAKFSLKEPQMLFIEQCKRFGFKDRSEVVRTALDRLYVELIQQRLSESAELYAEIYEDDEDVHEWMNAALSEWPK